jgi:lipopolysaccharide transport system permease protein
MSAGYRDLAVRADGPTLLVDFTLEHRGQVPWTRARKLALGYQVYDPDTSAFLAEGAWVAIERELNPGDRHAVVALPIELPREAGHYRVYLSAMDEVDGWYYEQEWPFVVIEARVDEKGVARVDSTAVTTLAGLRRQQWPRRIRIAVIQPWQTIWKNRRLISSMVRREVASRYRGSLGDAAWTILHPLLLMLTYYFVFGVVLRSRFGDDNSQAGYVLNFLAGMLPWLPFSEAVGRAPGSMWEHRNFIKKLVFPVEIIPVNQTAAALVTQAFALLVFMALLIATRGMPPSTALLLPVLLIPQVMLTAGVCWTLSALGVYLRDLGQVIGFLLTICFFLTPICYPYSRSWRAIAMSWCVAPNPRGSPSERYGSWLRSCSWAGTPGSGGCARHSPTSCKPDRLLPLVTWSAVAPAATAAGAATFAPAAAKATAFAATATTSAATTATTRAHWPGFVNDQRPSHEFLPTAGTHYRLAVRIGNIHEPKSSSLAREFIAHDADLIDCHAGLGEKALQIGFVRFKGKVPYVQPH